VGGERGRGLVGGIRKRQELDKGIFCSAGGIRKWADSGEGFLLERGKKRYKRGERYAGGWGL